jgi:TetR/AcrR family transcriptional regulator
MAENKIKRERDAEVARETILNAAEAIFARVGFDGARVDEIAAASGYNKSLLFHYFGDKAGLYHTVVQRLRKQAGVELGQILALFIGDDTEVPTASQVHFFLERTIRWYFTYLVEHPHLLRIIAWEEAKDWEVFLSSPIGQEDLQAGRLTVAFLHRAKSAGHIHPDIDANLLIANILGLCQSYLLSLRRYQQGLNVPNQITPEVLTHGREQIVKLVLHGTLVPPKEASHGKYAEQQHIQ